MSPDDKVQITMTRTEVMRIHAALAALCEMQKAFPDMPTAVALGGAVDDIEGVLPRLVEHFPDDEKDAYHLAQVAADTKTYASEPEFERFDQFDMKVSDLHDLSPQEAQAIFASEYDDAIRAVLGTLTTFTDYTDEDFQQVLLDLKDLMGSVIPIPKGLTVSAAQPYVQVSDLLTLGRLSYEMYNRQDQVEHLKKPF